MIINIVQALWRGEALRVNRLLCVALLLIGGFVFAADQKAILSVSGGVQSGVEIVRIRTNTKQVSTPVVFSTKNPARVAVDFSGYSSALNRGSVEFSGANAKSANVIQTEDRTRVIVSLKQSSSYKVNIDGEDVVLTFDVSQSLQGDAAGSPNFSEVQNTDVKALKDIDFRKNIDGSGRVLIDLATSQVDIKQQGDSLVIDLLKSVLPEGLRRRLDVSDFGTAVQTIQASQFGEKVRLVVQVKGNWEHSAYQSESKLVVEIREQKTDPSKVSSGIGFTGEKLSLNFQNIEVRSLLQVIADFTNFNIVTSDSVTGSVTLRLKDVPWDQALDIILQAKGLDKRRSGNVIWIAPKDEISAREKAELESKASIESLESLRTQSFQMNYAKAVDIAAQLIGGGAVGSNVSGVNGQNNARILSVRGSVIAEPRTNQLFVTDVPSRLEQVQQLMLKLDIPVRQVLIEARIVEADDKFSRSLGVKLGGTDLRGVRGGDAGYAVGGGNRVAFAGTYNAVTTTSGSGSTALDTLNTSFVNMPASGIGGVNPASFAVSLFNSTANRFLNLEISALEADGRGKIVSSPRVVTADQVKAVIEQGVEYPYQTATASGATALAFRKAGLKLEVTPQITPEGNVILEVEVNKDSPGEILLGARAINTKRVQTQVLVENGGTVVIGGIFESEDQDSVTKVPFLGDMPVVGNLFKTRNKVSNRSEMLVFITPKVVMEKASVR